MSVFNQPPQKYDTATLQRMQDLWENAPELSAVKIAARFDNMTKNTIIGQANRRRSHASQVSGPVPITGGVPASRRRPADYVHGMQCPHCSGGSGVIDSRPLDSTIRRRRVCFQCKRRFTTFELITAVNPVRIGKDLQQLRRMFREQAIEARKFADRLDHMANGGIDEP